MSKKEGSRHPILDESRNGDRHRALWYTNSDLPVQHLLTPNPPDIPVLSGTSNEDAVQVKSAEAVKPTPPTKTPEQPNPEIPLSDFSKWLLQMEPSDARATSFSSHETRIPEIRQSDGEAEEVSTVKPTKEKKKKDKKKKKKKKKSRAKKEKKLAAKLGAIDEGLVTDTLAELAAKRGYKEEAIAMYRLLVSMHPEKAAYYIEQIQALRSNEEE